MERGGNRSADSVWTNQGYRRTRGHNALSRVSLVVNHASACGQALFAGHVQYFIFSLNPFSALWRMRQRFICLSGAVISGCAEIIAEE